MTFTRQPKLTAQNLQVFHLSNEPPNSCLVQSPTCSDVKLAAAKPANILVSLATGLPHSVCSAHRDDKSVPNVDVAPRVMSPNVSRLTPHSRLNSVAQRHCKSAQGIATASFPYSYSTFITLCYSSIQLAHYFSFTHEV